MTTRQPGDVGPLSEIERYMMDLHVVCDENDALQAEVAFLKAEIELRKPPVQFYLAENGNEHLCVWMDDPDCPSRPIQVVNLEYDLKVCAAPLSAWIERCLPYRETGDDQ